MRFNKAFETQLAQLAAALPIAVESVNAVITRGGKTTHDPPYPSTENKTKADDTTEKPTEEDHSKRCTMGRRHHMNSMIHKYCRFP